MAYNPASIEKKWQSYWLTNKTFRALEPHEAGDRPKKYVLDMFPYPSGAGLHVGHPEGYTATDILSRYWRSTGFNVLHTMGWDAFGLPAEQYAIREAAKGIKTHPATTTKKNIDNFRRQIQMLGLSYDWDREIDTTDPKYYRWTQWIFLKLYNSYFDPFDNIAKPIAHLIAELENDNILIAPDGSIHINPVQEGLEAVSGEANVLRKWGSFSPSEQRDIIDGLRLAYTDEAPVNWCEGLGTVLANEEVIDGKSEVGQFPVERRFLRQWMMRITSYADRLIDGLEGLNWPESIKEMQRNWIGRSVGAEVDFAIVLDDEIDDLPPDTAEEITVFTTRPDTLYGATYLVLAPEHPLVSVITRAAQREAVVAYVAQSTAKSDRERQQDVKEKTGVFTGGYAIHPLTNEKVPVWIADYVLTGYGTGAIMAVPAHDDRDWEFAKKFGIPIIAVVKPKDGVAPLDKPFTEEGIAFDSGPLTGLPTSEAKEKVIAMLEDAGTGHRRVNYKLRDWLFSRQRYWGEPFPIVLDGAGNHFAVSESELPVTLPELEDFKPTGTPDGPLSKATEWRKYPGDLLREINTMPQWAGSCWYYLRYIDPKNAEAMVDTDKEEYWMPVDLYVGGVEHAVLHLLYARFWHKVLFDLGVVSTPEPFQRLVNQGLILGEMEYHFFEYPNNGGAISVTDVTNIEEEAQPNGPPKMFATLKSTGQRVQGTRVIEQLVEKKGTATVLKANNAIAVDARSFKMSKSRGNVVNPDEIVQEYGADCFRLYEMYMGPLEAQKPWNTRDIVGMWRFLHGVWRNLINDNEDGTPPATPRLAEIEIEPNLDRVLHRTIKKVGEDIEALRFNTAIAELIKLNNELTKLTAVPRELAEQFALLLAPFAPHLAEELWSRLGHTDSIQDTPWPTFDAAKLVESTIEVPVQINGKLRDKLVVAADASEDDLFTLVEASEKVKPWIEGKTIRKKLYVPKKMVNYVVN